MKGTLFSADFVKDSNGNLRLIEFNTDTAVITGQINNIDLSGLITVMQSNSIDTLDIIYKPYIHAELVTKVKEIIASDATFITTVNEHKEDFNTIYPTAVSDASNKFILRMAYDESAILDSTYAKNRLNVFNLFTADGSGSNSYTVSYYHSGSAYGEVNTLDYSLNAANIADLVVKDVDESHNPIDFYKVGSEVNGETEEARISAFIASNKAEDKVIENYHYNTDSVDSDGKITSYRQFAIVYGTDLDHTNILSYKISAVLDLPSSLTYNTGSYTNKLGDQHYYEFTTNFIKDGSAGVLSTHKIEKADGSYATLADVSVGDTIKSYFISGSPQVESDADTVDWYLTGSTFPSGSYITSSDVVYKETANLKYGGIIKLNIDNDDIYVGSGKQFLVYDSGSNRITFKLSHLLDPDNDYFYDASGNLIDIDTAEFVATTDTGLQFVELDVEDTDTYLISGSTTFNSIVSHNAPCFVAGTEVTMADGSKKNIEDVEIGDKVISHKFEGEGQISLGTVEAVNKKTVASVVQYTFDDYTTLQATDDHPLYSISHNGWASYDPAETQSQYGMSVEKIEEGTMIKTFEAHKTIINIKVIKKLQEVYNLKEISGDHNYYVNDYLAHNRGACFVAGTEIELEGGDHKNIEDIVEGDIVVTFNEETGEKEGKKVYETVSPIHDDIVTYSLEDGSSVTSTYDHPYYVEGLELKSSNPAQTNELYNIDKEVTKIGLGDKLIKIDGSTAAITGINAGEVVDTQTYLLRVEDNHNFYANGILVHNK